METASIYLLLLLLVLISGFATLYFLFSRKLRELAASKQDNQLLEYFQKDLQALRTSVDSTKDTVNKSLFTSNKNVTDALATSTKDIHERLTKAAEVIGELKKEAGAFTEVSRSMKDLQEFLKSPKLRGNIGEMVLKDLISQMFPKNSFHLQYSFKSGEKVDAAIKTDAGILPVDSKFPMENFQKLMGESDDKLAEGYRKAFVRDIKKHVQDISKKYILPEEGTLDFALMYVPSESVYYEISADTSLMDYARKERVYPVSPNTMYAALQTIMLSFEGKKVESRAKEVFKLLRALEKDYQKTSQHLSTLGSHLTNAYNKFGDVQAGVNLLGQKLTSTHQLESADDEKLLEE